jgi:hypothetical protein
MKTQPAGHPDIPLSPSRIEITRRPRIRRLLASRWLLFLARLLLLAGFLFTILAGLFGTQVGGSNFAIIFAWIAWWTVLKLILIPLGGRAWCSICPIPMPGEWLQQGALVKEGRGGFGLNLRWPRRLTNTWIQAAGFIAIGLFAGVTLTLPRVTAWVFIGLILAAVVLSLVFERRSFCRYVCPMGGFIGWFSQAAPVGMRVRDASVCSRHQKKTCYTGCADGYGCPWINFPAALQRNANCGLCMECLRTCPEDNMGLYLQSFGADLRSHPSQRLDEAWLGLVYLGCVVAFSIVFLGSWGDVKTAAYQIGTPGWWWYTLSFMALVLGLIPGGIWLAVWVGRLGSAPEQSLPKDFSATSRALLPLGLTAWMAFTVSFASVKLSSIPPVLTDPFGWGWNLFGTIPVSTAVHFTELSKASTILILLVGVIWSTRLVLRLYANRASQGSHQVLRRIRGALPTLLFIKAYTLGMLWLLAG